MLYALVMAGGSGTRLWPYSRSNRPKQFLQLGNSHTMLQETITRTLPLIPLEQFFIATGAAYVPLIMEQVPNLPRENMVAEPVGRGTAACIGLAALQMLRRDPAAVMVVLSADHRIANNDCYLNALSLGVTLAEQGHLVVLGLEAKLPHTSYGYIEIGQKLGQKDELLAYKVAAFHEKPSATQAQAYVATKRYLWNAGMFVWRADRILQELATYQPELMQYLELIDTYINEQVEDWSDEAVQQWSNIEQTSIDVAVMQHTDAGVVIPAPIGRQDVGDWNAVYEGQNHDVDANVVIGQHVGVATQRTLIYAGQRVVTTIGLEDFVVVDTDDAVLICPRDRAQDVKLLVTQLHQYQKYMA
jgi:mannose-1-phosphate guanylyltransferase